MAAILASNCGAHQLVLKLHSLSRRRCGGLTVLWIFWYRLSHELTTCLKVRAKGKALEAAKRDLIFGAGKHGFVPVTWRFHSVSLLLPGSCRTVWETFRFQTLGVVAVRATCYKNYILQLAKAGITQLVELHDVDRLWMSLRWCVVESRNVLHCTAQLHRKEERLSDGNLETFP